MADLFGKEPVKKNLFEEYCYVNMLYFDEKKGHVPLIIYPSEEYKDNKKVMRPIKFHPIWFFELEEQDALDHVDVEYALVDLGSGAGDVELVLVARR